MQRHLSVLACAIVVAVAGAGLLSPSANAAEYRKAAEPVVGQYIVVLKPGTARLANEYAAAIAPLDVVAGSMAAGYHGRLLYSYDRVLRGFAIRMSAAQARRMLQDSRVAWIQEDGIAHANAVQNNPDWGLDRIDQVDTNNSTTHQLSGTYSYTTTASNVHAYVLDTGIRATHGDFTGRVGAGFDAIGDGQGTNDCNGHGTHVSGTLGGTKYGVAKGVTIHAVRVLNCIGQGSSSQIVAGINWIAGHHVSPSVANMSIGFAGVDAATDTALNNLIASGVTVAVAAGNGNSAACNTTPAHLAAAFTVASTRKDDGRSNFSNYGTCVDLFAPGSAIVSDWNTSDVAISTLSGTSMASPHAAGVAALYLATHPTATPATVMAYLVNVATPSRVLAAGAGSPNLLLSVLSTHLPALPGIAPPTESFFCDDIGGNRFMCEADRPPAGVLTAYLWPNDNDFGSDYTAECAPGVIPPKNSTKQVPVTVSLTVGNRSASRTASTTFNCLIGGEVQ